MSPGGIENNQGQGRIWESLLKISEEVHRTSSIREFVASIHEILSDLILARNFFIALYEESSNKYFFPYFEDEYDKVETTGVSIDYDESMDVHLNDMSGSLTDYVRRTGIPARFGNRKGMDKFYESGELKPFGTLSASFMGVPLKLSGITVGVLVVHDYHIEDAYTATDEELMVFASDHIARAIESVRAEEMIQKQHQLVLEHRQAITDSIRYATRIQKAVLPSRAYMEHVLPDHFILFRPKDIISGDFYWVQDMGRFKVVIVSDCTGHGVPGAMMSMLGITLLNEHFRTFGVGEPDAILGHLRDKVKEILAQEGSEDDQKDGMDMAIVLINQERRELHFAGANRPLFLFRKKEEGGISNLLPSFENDDYELFIFKGDYQPIGANWEEKAFSRHSVKLQEGDSLYMFTDGFVDQYGGENRKKFKIQQFRELLLSVQMEPMERQKLLIEEAFEKWRGNNEQIDDVCVLGLRVHFP